MNFSNIDKQYIRDHTFSSDGLTFPVEHKATAMLRPGDSGIPLLQRKNKFCCSGNFQESSRPPHRTMEISRSWKPAQD